MRMKKKLVSLALAVVMMASVSMPALATSKFNMGVFDGRQDAFVYTDEMTGSSLVFPRIGVIEDGGTYISFDDGSRISVSSSLRLTDSFDICFLNFSRTGLFSTGLNSVIVKIGDNRYTFSNGQTDATTVDGIVLEDFNIPIKKELIPFMNDFIEHSSDEIKVRFVCDTKYYDFVLTNDMKSQILVIYDLYVTGNGTRERNLHDITECDSTIVLKNGKRIEGNVSEKILITLLDGIVNS